MGVDIFHMTLVCPFLEEQFLTKHLLGSNYVRDKCWLFDKTTILISEIDKNEG